MNRNMAATIVALAAVATAAMAQAPAGGPQGAPGARGFRPGPGAGQGFGGGGGFVHPGNPGNPGGAGGDWREMVMDRVLQNAELRTKLGITEEQAQKLKDALYELRQKEIKLRAEMEIAGMDQARLITEETVDEAALLAAVEKTGQIHTEMAKLRMQRLLAVQKTLTPEQRAKIRKHIAERRRADADRGREMGKPRGPQQPTEREVRGNERRPDRPKADKDGARRPPPPPEGPGPDDAPPPEGE